MNKLSKPMSDEVLADYEQGFEAEGELRGTHACQEIRRLRQVLEVVRGELKKTIKGHEAMMRVAIHHIELFPDLYGPNSAPGLAASKLRARLEKSL
jgi:aspartate aminotransferase-like enzyme